MVLYILTFTFQTYRPNENAAAGGPLFIKLLVLTGLSPPCVVFHIAYILTWV
jgi:hypothetical protein